MCTQHITDLVALQHAHEATTLHAALLSLSSLLPSPSLPLQDGNKMQKCKHKREKEQQPLPLSSVPLAIANANDTHDAQAAYAASPIPMLNEMLLTIIGILHAAQLQDNITGWMCAGALQTECRTMWSWCNDSALVHTWVQSRHDGMQELSVTNSTDTFIHNI